MGETWVPDEPLRSEDNFILDRHLGAVGPGQRNSCSESPSWKTVLLVILLRKLDNGDNQRQWCYIHFIIVSQFSTDSAPSWPTPLGALPLPHPLTSAHPAADPSAGL